MRLKRIALGLFWLAVDEAALAATLFCACVLSRLSGVHAEVIRSHLTPGPFQRVLIAAARGILWWPSCAVLIALMIAVFATACRPASPRKEALVDRLRWAIVGSAALVFGSAFVLGYFLMSTLDS